MGKTIRIKASVAIAVVIFVLMLSAAVSIYGTETSFATLIFAGGGGSGGGEGEASGRGRGYYPISISGKQEQEKSNYGDDDDHETALIILSSLVPTHPSLDMLEETMASFSLLEGLSPNAPIFIMVDRMPSYASAKASRLLSPEARLEDERRLEQYVHALYKKFYGPTSTAAAEEYQHPRPYRNVHIIVNALHQHIGGSVAKGMSLLNFPNRTKFVYNIQHDFKFARPVNHTAVVKSLKEFPDLIHMIRFNKKKIIRQRGCNMNNTTMSLNDIHLEPTHGWSDNNHIASVAYYKDLLTMVSSLERPLEFPMQVNAGINCSAFAQHMYGTNGDPAVLEHLDGRLGYHLNHQHQR
jgi:hypothetical protein